jgi:hypothetical protein
MGCAIIASQVSLLLPAYYPCRIPQYSSLLAASENEALLLAMHISEG